MFAIRVMTFNIHGCRGADGNLDPDRIAAVIHKDQPDIVALQEVAGHGVPGQLSYLARTLGMTEYAGVNREGNAFLSRFPLRGIQEYDLGDSATCLRADVDAYGKRLHLFNVCLNPFPWPRRNQIVRLMGRELMRHPDLICPKLLVGDFADPWFGLGAIDWFFDVKSPRGFFLKPTYPSRFPLFSRDRCYFQGNFSVLEYRAIKNRETRLASPHLPLVLTFRVVDSLEYLKTKKIGNSRMEAAPGCCRNLGFRARSSGKKIKSSFLF